MFAALFITIICLATCWINHALRHVNNAICTYLFAWIKITRALCAIKIQSLLKSIRPNKNIVSLNLLNAKRQMILFLLGKSHWRAIYTFQAERFRFRHLLIQCSRKQRSHLAEWVIPNCSCLFHSIRWWIVRSLMELSCYFCMCWYN